MVDKQKLTFVRILTLVAATGTAFLYQRSDLIPVLVSARNLPAYSRISEKDLKLTNKPRSEVTEDAVVKTESLKGRYVRTAITAGHPIPKSALVPQDANISNAGQETVAIPLDASAALAFGGRLKSGEFVTVWDQGQNRRLLNRALVLDVIQVNRGSGTNHSEPFVVVVAVPVGQEAEVLASAANGKIAFTRSAGS